MGWFLFSCSLRERDPVNLVDYFRLRRDVRVRGNLVDFSMVSLRCAMGWFLFSCGARWGLGGLNQIGKDWKRKGGHCSKGGKDADGASLRVKSGEWRVESGERRVGELGSGWVRRWCRCRCRWSRRVRLCSRGRRRWRSRRRGRGGRSRRRGRGRWWCRSCGGRCRSS